MTDMKLLSVKEVADRTGVNIYTVYRWIKAGELTSFRLGSRGHLRISEHDLQEFLSLKILGGNTK